MNAVERVQLQKWKTDLLIGSRKSNLNQPGESGPYKTWDKNNPEHPDYTNPKNIPGEVKQLPIPGLPPELAMSASDIGQQVLKQRAAESKAGKIDRGSRSYIGDDHQRAREIDGEVYWYDEYKHMPFYQEILKKHGHTEELQQIQNEIQQKQSLKINQKLAMEPANIPLGDGMIKQSMTNMQNSNKQKYDLMYQEGFINRNQYEKQMKRTFGKDYKEYLVE